MTFDEALLLQSWHLACHRSEVANRGDFVRFETAVGDIAVFHDGSGVVAFDNRCPHRGARFFSEQHGNAPATCPYHGWSYRSGRLFVADGGRFTDCDVHKADIRRLEASWVGDFLFVAVAPLVGVEEQLAGLYGLVEAISRNIDERLDFSSYPYECYWPIAVENALEPYHISAIHRGTLGQLKLSDGINECHGHNSVWRAEVQDARSNRALKSLGRFFELDRQFEGYEFLYLFPFSMISSTYGYSYSVQNFFPASCGRTAFSSRLLAARTKGESSKRALASFFASSAALNRQVFEEDHGICKAVPSETWSSAPLRFAADNEAKIQHFRASCRSYQDLVAG